VISLIRVKASMRNVQKTMTVVIRNVVSRCFPLVVIVMIILIYSIQLSPTSVLKVYIICTIIYYLYCLYDDNNMLMCRYLPDIFL